MDDLFEMQPADYASVPSDEPRLPLLTAAEARLAVRVLLASGDVEGERLGRDLGRRLPDN
jgi:hypothetical protein